MNSRYNRAAINRLPRDCEQVLRLFQRCLNGENVHLHLADDEWPNPPENGHRLLHCSGLKVAVRE